LTTWQVEPFVSIPLLDTDILIDFLRGRVEARTLLVSYRARGDRPIISVVSVSEVWAGSRPAEKAPTAALLSALGKIPVSEKIAAMAGDFLSAYRRSHGVELADALIAATAVESNATLVTRNTKHYPMPAVTVLKPY
jgi:predicted nucleic acid-binding protein